MKEFNEATPDAPGVQYFSWGAEFKPWLWNPLWFVTSSLLTRVHRSYNSFKGSLTPSFILSKDQTMGWSQFSPRNVGNVFHKTSHNNLTIAVSGGTYRGTLNGVSHSDLVSHSPAVRRYVAHVMPQAWLGQHHSAYSREMDGEQHQFQTRDVLLGDGRLSGSSR